METSARYKGISMNYLVCVGIALLIYVAGYRTGFIMGQENILERAASYSREAEEKTQGKE